ncbi:DUF2334 domain-containing protein [Skermania sp. ID1734]|uniref:DUF2334 domain-containing protein n=1 Tax=Skermania sp. ID1734 TaxID=2597516 RepID=UPI00117FB985|nr:DUF2334 domain-containing protein [Skermania sp. ID1734]TSD96533.1 DUF2334 domain-containing protein [Skermania sp. ID1734]
MGSELIVSVSGIRTETRAHAAAFARELDERGTPMSLLVAPRLKDYRLLRDSATRAWLRERREHGDAIVLHGYDQAATKKRRAEFATLPEHEARLRLTAADRVLEECGLRTRIFAAPRWTVSEGAMAALPSVGFRVVAGLTGVHDLQRSTTVRGRVLGLGEGFRAEPWWCMALIMAAERTARRGGLVRLSISAAQLGKSGPRQAMLDAIDLALLHGAVPSVYRWDASGLPHAA